MSDSTPEPFDNLHNRSWQVRNNLTEKEYYDYYPYTSFKTARLKELHNEYKLEVSPTDWKAIAITMSNQFGDKDKEMGDGTNSGAEGSPSTLDPDGEDPESDTEQATAEDPEPDNEQANTARAQSLVQLELEKKRKELEAKQKGLAGKKQEIKAEPRDDEDEGLFERDVKVDKIFENLHDDSLYCVPIQSEEPRFQPPRYADGRKVEKYFQGWKTVYTTIWLLIRYGKRAHALYRWEQEGEFDGPYQKTDENKIGTKKNSPFARRNGYTKANIVGIQGIAIRNPNPASDFSFEWLKLFDPVEMGLKKKVQKIKKVSVGDTGPVRVWGERTLILVYKENDDPEGKNLKIGYAAVSEANYLFGGEEKGNAKFWYTARDHHKRFIMATLKQEVEYKRERVIELAANDAKIAMTIPRTTVLS
jgi:hypothetical protein